MSYRNAGFAKLHFAQSDSPIADILERACRGVTTMLGQRWGLLPPWETRVFVVHSWLEGIRCEGPLGLVRAVGLLLFGLPPWALWQQRVGAAFGPARRPRVVIKAPTAANPALRDHGKYGPLVPSYLEAVLCHELTHACTFRLDPPFWLNEGLALLAEDRFSGRYTLCNPSLASVDTIGDTPLPQGTLELIRQPSDKKLHALFRCYRLVRYLDDTSPCVLRRILSPIHPVDKHESVIARELGLLPNQVMHQLEERAVRYYRRDRGPTVRGFRKSR